MAEFTLDSIREAADKKYGSSDILLDDGEVVRLLNPLRLDKARRKKLLALQGSANEDGADEADAAEALEQSLLVVAEKAAPAKRLIKAIDGDLAVLMGVFEKFNGETELGEASASQS